MQIYDSLFDTIDSHTKDGVFALANLTALCYGMNPAATHFKQDVMRLHLVRCMEGGTQVHPFHW